MELKGKNSKKIPKVKKDKMNKTLKKMDESRKVDSATLRVLLTQKMQQLAIESKKADEAIIATESKVRDYKDMKLRIEGALISLQEVLQSETNV
jgi:hypothetical protein